MTSVYVFMLNMNIFTKQHGVCIRLVSSAMNQLRPQWSNRWATNCEELYRAGGLSSTLYKLAFSLCTRI